MISCCRNQAFIAASNAFVVTCVAWSLGAGAAFAQSPAAKSAPAASAATAKAIAGVWITKSIVFPDGLENALTANFTSTPWAPLSAGRPEDVRFADFETQRQAAIARVKADGTGGQRRPQLPYTDEGKAADTALHARPASGSKVDPYAKCLPQNATSIFTLAAYASGLMVFANGDEVAVLTDSNTRVIHVGAQADKFTPAYNGVSVAHWEGDHLVIVTSNWLGSTDGNWPMSPDAKLTETVWLSPDSKTLNIKGVYEDKRYLKEPVAHMTYLKRGGKYYDPLPANCADEVKGAAEYEATFGGAPEKLLPLGSDVPPAK